MNIGKKIRELRQKKKIGIKPLAEKLDINYTYLSKIENHKANPSKETVIKIAKYFNCDADELMILADRIPDDIQKILRENSKEAIKYLRKHFSNG